MKKIVRLTEQDLIRLVNRVIKEANKELESRYLIEQSRIPPPNYNHKVGNYTYSIQMNPQNKRFRIMVTTPKFPKPTDAATVFGQGSYWRDYTTQNEAQKVIDSLSPNLKGIDLE